MKIGARTLKTGIAVALSLAIPALLNFPSGSVLAAISAIFALQPSVKKSINTLKDRIIANLIGALVAICITLTVGNHFIIVGLAACLLIAILNQLNLSNVIGLATVTLIVIMQTTEDNFILYATIRVTATIMGVVIAFLVNTILFPPKYEKKLYHVTDYSTTEIMKFLRASVRKNSQYPVLKKDLKWIKSELNRMDVYLSLFKDEGMVTRKKDRVQKMRKVVVYRQIIATTKGAYNLSYTFHKYENSFNHFPKDLRILIRERLETLLTAHEQILLKFNGRVSPDSVNFIAYKSTLRKEFMQSFFDEASLEEYMHDDYGQSNAVIHIMSSILKYEEYLEHLNILVSSYKGNDWNPDTEISNIEHIEQ